MRDAICKRYHSVEQEVENDKDSKSDSHGRHEGVMQRDTAVSDFKQEKKILLKILLRERYSFCRIIYINNLFILINFN